MKRAILMLCLAPMLALGQMPTTSNMPVTADGTNHWLPALRNGNAPDLPAGSKVAGVAIVTGTGLPPQTGNSGKYLTTNGTAASWGTIDLTAYQTKAGVLALGGFSSITGTLPVANLPTGTTSGTIPLFGTGGRLTLGSTPASGGFLGFGNSAPSGYLMQSPTQSGDATRPGFNWTHIAQLFEVGQPKDEIAMWGYNLTSAGGRADSVDTAIGLSIEGSYNDGGAHYAEAHLLFVDGSNIQHRPFSWRINKTNTADVVLNQWLYDFNLNNSNVAGNPSFFKVNPTQWLYISAAAEAVSKGLKFEDEGSTVTFTRVGGTSSDAFSATGFGTWTLNSTLNVKSTSTTSPAFTAHAPSQTQDVADFYNDTYSTTVAALQVWAQNSGEVFIAPSSPHRLNIAASAYNGRDIVLNPSGGIGFGTTTDPGAGNIAVNGLTESNFVMTDASKILVSKTAAQMQTAIGVIPQNVQTTTLVGTTASITFTVPAGYNNLRLTLQARGSQSATAVSANITFNSDTTAGNYYWVETYSNGGSVSSANSGASATSFEAGEITAATGTASSAGMINLTIPNYAGTTFYKEIYAQAGMSTSNFTTRYIENHQGSWKSTAAITSITLTPSAGSFLAGTVATLIAE